MVRRGGLLEEHADSLPAESVGGLAFADLLLEADRDVDGLENAFFAPVSEAGSRWRLRSIIILVLLEVRRGKQKDRSLIRAYVFLENGNGKA